MIKGLIVKSVGGFYYVEAADGAYYECRARGIFRKTGLTPLVGDLVQVELQEAGTGVVSTVEPRKNSLIRPPLANVDILAIIASVCDPEPNLFVIDKLIAIAVYKEITPVLIVNKSDLGDTAELEEIYRQAGLAVCIVSAQTGEGVDAAKELLKKKLCVFTGNSGVGKSSLLNAIDSRLELPTGEISRKLGRGRHTTRHVELYHFAGGYLADTPGFSSVDIEKYESVLCADLAGCFTEFLPYLTQCKFSSCSHTGEKGCAVGEAVAAEKIHPSRYKSYLRLYDAMKGIKEWNLK